MVGSLSLLSTRPPSPPACLPGLPPSELRVAGGRCTAAAGQRPAGEDDATAPADQEMLTASDSDGEDWPGLGRAAWAGSGGTHCLGDGDLSRAGSGMVINDHRMRGGVAMVWRRGGAP